MKVILGFVIGIAAISPVAAKTVAQKVKQAPHVVSTAPNLFGIDLNKPLSVVACPSADAMCVTETKANATTIAFPRDKPIYLLIDLRARTENGLVQQVYFATQGLKVQSLVMNDLVAKFGMPTTKNITRMGNQLGASFDVVTADWKFSDGALLHFHGVLDGDARFGEVVLNTKAQEDREQADLANEAKSSPHL